MQHVSFIRSSRNTKRLDVARFCHFWCKESNMRGFCTRTSISNSVPPLSWVPVACCRSVLVSTLFRVPVYRTKILRELKTNCSLVLRQHLYCWKTCLRDIQKISRCKAKKFVESLRDCSGCVSVPSQTCVLVVCSLDASHPESQLY